MHIINEYACRWIHIPKYNCALYKISILLAIKLLSELKLDIHSFKTGNTPLTSRLKNTDESDSLKVGPHMFGILRISFNMKVFGQSPEWL